MMLRQETTCVVVLLLCSPLTFGHQHQQFERKLTHRQRLELEAQRAKLYRNPPPPTAPRDCYQGMANNSTKYVFIEPEAGDLMKCPYLCDTQTDGGGWIVILQRTSKSNVDFNRNWQDYKHGFGDIDTFWLGNEAIYRATNRSTYELRIDMKAPRRIPASVTYQQFSIASEQDGYRLSIGGFNGTIRDGMSFQNGMKFTTKDKDNDDANLYNCSFYWGGGWWYKACFGAVFTRPWAHQRGRKLHSWKGYDTKNKMVNYAEMKIRYKFTRELRILVEKKIYENVV